MQADCGIDPQLGSDPAGNTFVRFETDCRERQFCKVSWYEYGDTEEHEYIFISNYRPTTWMAVVLPYELICGSFTEDPDDVRGPNSTRK